MTVLGRLSVRARLYFATVFALLLLTIVGGMGYWGLDRARATTQLLFAKQVQTLTDMAELRTTLGGLRRAEKDIIINFNNVDAVTTLRAAWGKDLQQLRQGLDQVRQAQAEDAEFTGAVDKALAETQLYADGIKPVFDQIEQALIDGAIAGAYAEKVKGHMDDIDALLAKLSVRARAAMDDARAALDARSAAMAVIIAVAVLLGLAVLVPLTWFTVRSITGSLDQARALAERIASGDLTQQVATTQTDELGQLIGAMGRMQQALRALVGQVQHAVGSISTASHEIASGNLDLSQRTEQTASNLQQTAASMDSLTGNVQQSAESARQASGYASAAAEVAVRGGAVVEQVVQTMGAISESSRRIGDITGVIDSIAFQTNILALNAAVEAARAGEQGRGFAVVAGEVRALAQRSAEAAKEIKQLIGTSVERVEGGSRLVAQAGETMTEIVGSVRRVSDIVSEITAAAAEQSDSIGQVGQAVAHLDQMTQQNAALVEQSSAASESLRDQAQALTMAAAQFRLGDDAQELHEARAQLPVLPPSAQ